MVKYSVENCWRKIFCGKYSVETCWWKIFGRMGGDQLTGGVELTVGDELAGGDRLLTRPTEAAMPVCITRLLTWLTEAAMSVYVELQDQ